MPKVCASVPVRHAWLRGLTLAAVALLSVGCSSGHQSSVSSSASTSASTPDGARSPTSAAGSTPAAGPSASVRATPTVQGSNVQLHKGLILQIVLPASGLATGQQTRYSVEPAGSAVVSPVEGAPGFFTGTLDGTAKVVVTQTPPCSPGVECAAHIVNLGSVTVTVVG